jgi:hypothetical protein
MLSVIRLRIQSGVLRLGSWVFLRQRLAPRAAPGLIGRRCVVSLSMLSHNLDEPGKGSLAQRGSGRIGDLCSSPKLRHLMSILRATHSPTNSSSNASSRPPLRVLASGTLFLTHRLLVPAYPEAGGVARAQSVQSLRGGHGANVLVVLAQFRSTRVHVPSPGGVPVVAGGSGARSVGDVQFSGPLAGNEEGALVVKELEAQGVATTFSMVREGKGVPAAWVIESGQYFLCASPARGLCSPDMHSTASATKTVM